MMPIRFRSAFFFTATHGHTDAAPRAVKEAAALGDRVDVTEADILLGFVEPKRCEPFAWIKRIGW